MPFSLPKNILQFSRFAIFLEQYSCPISVNFLQVDGLIFNRSPIQCSAVLWHFDVILSAVVGKVKLTPLLKVPKLEIFDGDFFA
jgi:hypothetical protein